MNGFTHPPDPPRKKPKPVPIGITRTGNRKRSEERQRTAQFRVRLTPDEKQAMEKAAANAGLDVAAFIRLRTIGQVGARTRRAGPTPDVGALARLRAQIGYIGNNLTQLSDLANMGDLDTPLLLSRTLSTTLKLLGEVRDLMKAPRPIPDLSGMADLTVRLNAGGHDLNQLTRLANTRDLDRPDELEDVLSFLLGLLAEVRATVDSIP